MSCPYSVYAGVTRLSHSAGIGPSILSLNFPKVAGIVLSPPIIRLGSNPTLYAFVNILRRSASFAIISGFLLPCAVANAYFNPASFNPAPRILFMNLDFIIPCIHSGCIPFNTAPQGVNGSATVA